MKSFDVQQVINDGGYLQPLGDRQREMRQTFPNDYESDFVGLEANVKKLVGYLVDEDNVQVVSITGMGGLGKTTLARQVFNHDDVKRQFYGLTWVCVSQDFTRKNVWQKILVDLNPKEENKILQMTESTLQAGWKVLVTSRNEGVVMRSNRTSIIKFKPECLTSEDSWTLFQRIVFPKKDASGSKIDVEMEDMGKQMIKHCGGLPLAIKVLGGLLAAKYTMHDWKRLSENIGSHIVGRTNLNDGNNSSVYHVLSLSFEEFPSYLKHCFLYMAHFPEDYVVDVEDFSYYLAVEGIIEPRYYDGETIQDVGDSYIVELVMKNMVISKRDVMTLRFETCHLHDMMREICLFKAKEENFLQISNSSPGPSNFQSPVTSRRFVSHNPDTLQVERDINNPKLRSLMVVPVNEYYRKHWKCIKSWKLSDSSYTRLELLRVLVLSHAEFEGGKLPSSIGNMAEVTHLPSSIGNLMLLIYLNLDIRGSIFVPYVLMGMRDLRYLALPSGMNEKTKLQLSNIVNLETLKNFSTKTSSLEDLRGMVRLRTLEIMVTGETSIETLSASIGGLKHLENLDILKDRYDDRSRRMKDEDIVLDFIHLKCLTLGISLPRFPKEQHFPSHLTVLVLCSLDLEEDPMPILEKLLELKDLCIRHNSFRGRKMVCSSNGFPQLQNLVLCSLGKWEEWIIEEGSMPVLHSLNIIDCRKLKELPHGLSFIYSLKKLSVDRKA